MPGSSSSRLEHDIGSLLKTASKGTRFPPDIEETTRAILGLDVTLEGLSRLFQPGFPGVRTFTVEARTTPDSALEFTLVGIARDGAPVWTGTRAFVQGRDGSLELHHGFDEVVETYQSRNLTVDIIRRELDILRACPSGNAARLTIDADGVGRYVCALHGFVFADETEEGPPLRSSRALDPASDRQRLREATKPLVERVAARQGLGKLATEAALDQFYAARSPFDFARVTLPGSDKVFVEGDDRELGVGALGCEFLLSRDTPPWRGALYVEPRDFEAKRLGEEFRKRKTIRSESRLAKELEHAKEALKSADRAARVEGLRQIGMLAPPHFVSLLKPLTEGEDRRTAALARKVMRQLTGSDLPDRILDYAQDGTKDPRKRGLAYRVLAEHYPVRLRDRVTMLRVHPDARIQRGIIPVVEREGEGPSLASFLAANPWGDRQEEARPGLLELRIELIERLTRLTDPVTLPALIGAFRTRTPPPPAEMLALSRALVSFPDARAQRALMEVAGRFERPAIP